jgi:hypothetical protein
MKFIPILFSTAMVQAILEGRKTQTRRTKGLEFINAEPDGYSFTQWVESPVLAGEDTSGNIIEVFTKGRFAEFSKGEWNCKCPYGQPGDVLWVRENILCHPAYSSKDHKAGLCGPLFLPNGENVAFRGYVADWKNEHPVFKVIPSIHMPKPACRIFLEVVSVRVERLRDISESDAKSEGVFPIGTNPDDVWWYKDYMGTSIARMYNSAIKSFASLWSKINGVESWNSENPWVWVVEFKRIEKPENFK